MNFPTEYQLLFESIFALPQPSPLIWLVDMEKNGLTGMIAEGGGGGFQVQHILFCADL